jgi:hypothetical protein
VASVCHFESLDLDKDGVVGRLKRYYFESKD